MSEHNSISSDTLTPKQSNRCCGKSDNNEPDIRLKGPRRLKLVGLINELGRFFFRNGHSWPRLDETALLKQACDRTGLDDFGDESFRQPLRILLESLETEAELHFIGRICVQSELLRLLNNRLRLVADRQRHPEIAAEVIRRPLFITGLPRSGTTLLHALLAQDPVSRAPLVWEVMAPSPPPQRNSYASDRRIAQTASELRWIKVIMPDFKTVHLINARLPQECIAITSLAFRSYVFESMYHVHSYRRWHDAQDKRPAYEFHRQFLQHLQWRCPGDHWVLKAPSHLLALESLFQVYPDAGIIMTHRDPLKVLPSCASFTQVLREGFTDRLNKKDLGLEIRHRWGKGAHLAIESRQRVGSLAERFVDVRYQDLMRDPMVVVQRIYRHYDMELTEAAQISMRRFLAENPQNKNGKHCYSLEEFGLQPEEERRRFRFYTDYFGIKSEL
jgi:hypothetical protein